MGAVMSDHLCDIQWDYYILQLQWEINNSSMELYKIYVTNDYEHALSIIISDY